MKVDCPDCNGKGVIDPCPHCKGEGKIEHDCRGSVAIALVADIYGCESDSEHYGSYESLGIYRCKVCNQLWKIRFQSDPGTGSDHIWIRPGESSRHYSFPEDEATTVAQILNAKTVADLPEGLASDAEYVRSFAEGRAKKLRA